MTHDLVRGMKRKYLTGTDKTTTEVVYFNDKVAHPMKSLTDGPDFLTGADPADEEVGEENGEEDGEEAFGADVGEQEVEDEEQGHDVDEDEPVRKKQRTESQMLSSGAEDHAQQAMEPPINPRILEARAQLAIIEREAAARALAGNPVPAAAPQVEEEEEEEEDDDDEAAE